MGTVFFCTKLRFNCVLLLIKFHTQLLSNFDSRLYDEQRVEEYGFKVLMCNLTVNLNTI